MSSLVTQLTYIGLSNFTKHSITRFLVAERRLSEAHVLQLRIEELDIVGTRSAILRHIHGAHLTLPSVEDSHSGAGVQFQTPFNFYFFVRIYLCFENVDIDGLPNIVLCSAKYIHLKTKELLVETLLYKVLCLAN